MKKEIKKEMLYSSDKMKISSTKVTTEKKDNTKEESLSISVVLNQVSIGGYSRISIPNLDYAKTKDKDSTNEVKNNDQFVDKETIVEFSKDWINHNLTYFQWCNNKAPAELYEKYKGYNLSYLMRVTLSIEDDKELIIELLKVLDKLFMSKKLFPPEDIIGVAKIFQFQMNSFANQQEKNKATHGFLRVEKPKKVLDDPKNIILQIKHNFNKGSNVEDIKIIDTQQSPNDINTLYTHDVVNIAFSLGLASKQVVSQTPLYRRLLAVKILSKVERPKKESANIDSGIPNEWMDDFKSDDDMLKDF